MIRFAPSRRFFSCRPRLFFGLIALLPMSGAAATPDLASCDVWSAACHYTNSSREASYDINRVVIHKTQGSSAAGAASWFANCSSGGSAHYTFDKSNGYCYQSVREDDIAWHAGYGSTNNNSVGIEHSGWVANNDTSTACYDESAVEVRSCVVYYGVPANRSYIIAHSEVPGCSGTGGGTNCHSDPGPYWNWSYFMSKVTGPSDNTVSEEQAVVLPDGRMASVAVFTDGTVRANAQTAFSGSWGGWGSLGGSGFNRVSLANYGDGRLVTFGVGTASQIWVNAQVVTNGGWGGWSSLGGPTFSEVKSILYNDERLAVAACGNGTAVWINAQNTAGGTWGGWSSIGGSGFVKLDLVKIDERLIAFGVGNATTVWVNAQSAPSSPWGGWTSLGGPTFSSVRALVLPDKRLMAVACGNGTAVWVNAQNSVGGSWSGWSSLGGSGFKRVDPVLMPDGRVIVAGVGDATAVNVIVKPAGGAWGVWQTLPGGGFSTADALHWDNGRLACVAHAPGGVEWVTAQTVAGGSWTSWASVGGTLK